MDRACALDILGKYVKNKNLIKHMIAAEAVMRHYAVKFNGDPDEWGLAGLMHDVDVELTKDCPGLHGKKGSEILRENGFNEKIIAAVANHPKEKPEGDEMSRMLYSADQITGLIVAGALIHPDKKLASIDRDFILKRFDEKRFAAGVKRDRIKSIEAMGISLEDFVAGSYDAMKNISGELGL